MISRQYADEKKLSQKNPGMYHFSTVYPQLWKRVIFFCATAKALSERMLHTVVMHTRLISGQSFAYC